LPLRAFALNLLLVAPPEAKASGYKKPSLLKQAVSSSFFFVCFVSFVVQAFLSFVLRRFVTLR
jgi:hypothetical protein